MMQHSDLQSGASVTLRSWSKTPILSPFPFPFFLFRFTVPFAGHPLGLGSAVGSPVGCGVQPQLRSILGILESSCPEESVWKQAGEANVSEKDGVLTPVAILC